MRVAKGVEKEIERFEVRRQTVMNDNQQGCLLVNALFCLTFSKNGGYNKKRKCVTGYTSFTD
jgi:hypothetical protein